MKNSSFPKLHPVTLKFSEKWENDYEKYTQTEGLEFDRMVSLVGLIVTIISVVLFSYVNGTISPLNGVLFGAFASFLGCIFVFSRSPWWGRNYYLLANIIIFISSIILIVIMYNSQKTARPFVFGYIYMVFLICSVLAIPYIHKSAHFILLSFGFLFMAYAREYYDTITYAIITTHLACGVLIAIGVSYQFEKRNRLKFIYGKFAEIERRRSNELLLNILPQSIANKLQGSTYAQEQIVEHYQEASILFTDMVGFTKLSDTLGPIKTVKMLNEIFSYFDEIVANFEVEKIKTIGDSYMIAAGVPTISSDHFSKMANVALSLQEAATDYIELTGLPVQIRIGIHSGPVVAGIIGTKKFLYDVWGDTVNIASRLESSGEANKIHVSKEFMELNKDRFSFIERGEVYLKGKGQALTYYLEKELA